MPALERKRDEKHRQHPAAYRQAGIDRVKALVLFGGKKSRGPAYRTGRMLEDGRALTVEPGGSCERGVVECTSYLVVYVSGPLDLALQTMQINGPSV